MNRLLFVYGTLLAGMDNEYARFLKNHSQIIDKGTMQGRMYMIDWYPGVVESENKADQVHGQVLEIVSDVKELLERLDEYEGYSGFESVSSEFVRKQLAITCGNKIRNCWVYLYNHRVDHFKLIGTGDFLNYRK